MVKHKRKWRIATYEWHYVIADSQEEAVILFKEKYHGEDRKIRRIEKVCNIKE